ncbi:MAG TPA: transporter substrate-binding domain-containing protein, partial [bacterium]|nr:transporter substrate-binding domain-containing protein [bacterium]
MFQKKMVFAFVSAVFAFASFTLRKVLSEHRKRRCLFAIGALFAFLCLLSTSEADRSKIVVGTGDAFRPMVFLDENGLPAGRDVALWQLWSRKTGIEVEFRLTEWSEVIPALLREEVDVVSGASYSPERGQLLAFTDPYQVLSAYAFFDQNTRPVSRLLDMQGMTVGVLGGSTIEESLRQQVPEAILAPFPDYETMVSSIRGGRVNVLLGEEP